MSGGLKPVLMVLGTVVACYAVQARAASWVYVEDASSEDITWYVDESSMVNNRGVVTVWEKKVYSRPQLLNSQSDELNSYVSTKTLSLCDCYGRKRTSVELITYNGSGRVVDHLRREPVWFRVVPGTAGEALFNFVCAPIFESGAVAAAAAAAAADAAEAASKSKKNGDR